MPELSRYRLLIFDWDGTLEDSAEPIVESITQILQMIGKVPPARANIRKIIGLGLIEGLAVLYPGENAVQLAQQCKTAAAGMPALTDRAESQASLFAGARDMLTEFRQSGFWLAVATGKSRAGLDHALQRHAVTDFFLTTRTADDARSKPHPEMLLSILDELGVMPDDALMIGDTTYDLDMANAAGMDCVGVTYGVHSIDTLGATQHAKCLVDALSELRQVLAGRARAD